MEKNKNVSIKGVNENQVCMYIEQYNLTFIFCDELY